MLTAIALGEIKQKLLRKPSLIDGRAAAVRIISERHKCGPALATIRLDELQFTNVINDLFKAAMPQEFEHEFKKAGGSRVDVATRFFPTLGFPVYQDHVLSLAQNGEDPRAFSIPIGSLNPHACLDCSGFENLDVMFQLSYLLYRPRAEYFDQPIDESFWTHMAQAYKLPDTVRPTGFVNLLKLVKTFETKRSPLRYLPVAMDLIAYSTGCIFFDFNDDDGGRPEIGWDPDSVRWLREQYQLAQTIEVRMDKLHKWLKAAPRERVAQACRLYQKVR